MLKKKSLGQNFLTSKAIVKSILDASDPTGDEIVVEVGPGEGFMTEELLKFSSKVIIIEKDYRLIPILGEKFNEPVKNGKLDIVEKDILDFDINTLKFYKHPYKVIANIPYYITGQIIRKFLESDYQPKKMTLLVQKEVAERIVAKDGKESLLSLSVKIFGEPKIIRKVGRGSFNPVPNVDSAVINIDKISKGKFDNIDEEHFFKVIHAGFAHKRKQLLPNISNIFGKEKTQEAFKKVEINPIIRAEDLSLRLWVELSKALK